MTSPSQQVQNTAGVVLTARSIVTVLDSLLVVLVASSRMVPATSRVSELPSVKRSGSVPGGIASREEGDARVDCGGAVVSKS